MTRRENGNQKKHEKMFQKRILYFFKDSEVKKLLKFSCTAMPNKLMPEMRQKGVDG